MSTTISMWLGIAFLALAIAAVILQAWLWGPSFWDEEAKKTHAPKGWLRVHALCGYAYGIIYVVMMWNMLPRLWEYQYELPARTVFHAVFGIAIGVLLLSKITILVFFRHFEGSMPYYGFGLLMCTVILTTLSVPYALQAHDFAGRTTDPDNVERVQRLLAKVDFGEAAVDVQALTTAEGFERGRQVLVRQCTVCHDMRTILAKPRTPQKWHDVSVRMLDKPSVFGEQLRAEDIPWVTAYLAAITPEIQASTKLRREAEREDEDLTDEMVAMAHAAPVDAAPRKIDPAEGDPLLLEHCTGCHELDELAEHGGDDLAGWRSVVAAMVDEGAEYDDATAAKLSAYLTQKYPPTEATNPPMPEAVAMAEPSDDGGEAGADTGGAAAEAGSDTGPTEASGDETGAEVAVEPKAKPKPRRSRGPRKPRSVAASDDAGVADDAGDEPAKPKAPAADANVGRALFLAKCKTCHGADGKGDTAFGRKLEIEPLSGLGVARIKSAVTDGVPGTKMKAYGGQLTAEEIADVAAFVKRL